MRENILISQWFTISLYPEVMTIIYLELWNLDVTIKIYLGLKYLGITTKNYLGLECLDVTTKIYLELRYLGITTKIYLGYVLHGLTQRTTFLINICKKIFYQMNFGLDNLMILIILFFILISHIHTWFKKLLCWFLFLVIKEHLSFLISKKCKISRLIYKNTYRL